MLYAGYLHDEVRVGEAGALVAHRVIRQPKPQVEHHRQQHSAWGDTKINTQSLITCTWKVLVRKQARTASLQKVFVILNIFKYELNIYNPQLIKWSIIRESKSKLLSSVSPL